MSLTFYNQRRRRAAARKAAELKAIQKSVEEVVKPVEVTTDQKQKKPSGRKTGAKNDSQSR